jgi:sec-independent protein translocase protein TatC
MSTDAAPVEGDEGRMTLVDHLTELRSRLIKSVLAVVAGGVICFVMYPQIFDVLIAPYERIATDENSLTGEAGQLITTDPLEGFSVRLKVAAYGGIALAMPVILFQIWRFVTPGLYAHERRYALPFVVSSMALFVTGASLAYYTLPRALDFLITIGGPDLITAFTPSRYFSLIMYMMLAFGIGFEFPILLIFLQMAGILEPQTLANVRRYAIVGIFVLVAVITPSGDPYSLMMLAVPMVLFYELSILAGKLIKRRRARAEAGAT